MPHTRAVADLLPATKPSGCAATRSRRRSKRTSRTPEGMRDVTLR